MDNKEDSLFYQLELDDILWGMSVWYYFATENFDKKLNSYLSDQGSYIPIDSKSRKKATKNARECRDSFSELLKQLVPNPRDYELDKRVGQYSYEKLADLYFDYVDETEIQETLDELKGPNYVRVMKVPDL